MTDDSFDSISELASDDELLNANYAIPDPVWDYADLWHHVMHLQQILETLVQLLAQQEEATPAVDQLIRSYLDQICDSAIVALHDLPTPAASSSHLLDAHEQGNYRVSN